MSSDSAESTKKERVYSLRYHPWASWDEFAYVSQLVHEPTRQREALTMITTWLTQHNSGLLSSSPHYKYLKMQQLILKTPKDDASSNFRLIQLVEMGASTSKYRKSKQGGKLAMTSVAEEMGFP